MRWTILTVFGIEGGAQFVSIILCMLHDYVYIYKPNAIIIFLVRKASIFYDTSTVVSFKFEDNIPFLFSYKFYFHMIKWLVATMQLWRSEFLV